MGYRKAKGYPKLQFPMDVFGITCSHALAFLNFLYFYFCVPFAVFCGVHIDSDRHEGFEHLDEGDREVDHVGRVGEPEAESIEGTDGDHRTKV